jgi:peptide/nickel transport system substrate-binding protein
MNKQLSQTAARVSRSLSLVAAFFLLVALPITPATAEDPVRGGTLTAAMPEAFKGFNPYQSIGRQGYNVAINVFETLTTYGADFIPKPMLATSWEQPDANTWRFHLRNDVSFHDGTPFDAEAVKFSVEQIKQSPQSKSLGAVSEVKVIDPLTVDFVLSGPFPTLPAVLTQTYESIVSPTAYKKAGADEFAKHPVGTGPFKFESQDSSGSVTLTRNDKYWLKDAKGSAYPYLDKVVYQIVPDRQTAALSVQSGDVDFDYEVPVAFVGSLKADPNLTVSETPSLGLNYVLLHNGRAPFDNRNKRRAAQFAIDRKSIVEGVLLGDGVAALGHIAPGSWAYDASIESQGTFGLTANPEKAKAELAEAGSPDGFEFTMVYPAEDPFTGIAQAMKAQLATVGINVKLEGKDWGALLDDLDAANFQALMIDWSGRTDEDLNFAPFYKSDGFENPGKYSNPKVDELLVKASTSTDIKERTKLYQEAQKLVTEDSPNIWINFPTDRKVMRNTVQGYENLGDYRMRFYNVWRKG